MRPGRQQGSKIWMLSKSLIPRFFRKQFWSKSIFWFRKVTTKQNLREFDFCVPTNRAWSQQDLKWFQFSIVKISTAKGSTGMAEVWQFFFHPSGSTGLDPRSHPAWMWKKQASSWCSWGNEATRPWSNIVCDLTDYTKNGGEYRENGWSRGIFCLVFIGLQWLNMVKRAKL